MARLTEIANALGSLRSAGLVAGSNPLVLTAAGEAAAGEVEPLPRGRALVDFWLRQLPKAAALALEALVAAYPRALGKQELAAATGYEPNGGTFNNALGRLRSLELAAGRGEVRASDQFFE